MWKRNPKNLLSDPELKWDSKTHHEELVTPTPCAEESDAVVEWLGRWNAATDSSEKHVIQTRNREWF